MAKLNYSPTHVISLFNDMARTYGAVNLISSFGFSHLWRKSCVRALALEPGHQCADLMCGMGEASTLMMKMAKNSPAIHAVDFSPEMTARCRESVSRIRGQRVRVETLNVFDLTEKQSYDRICCSFGLKTFDDAQLHQFADLIAGLLRPGGKAAFVEIHVPTNLFLRAPYLFYLRKVIPFIGSLCLGNPDCYRHLALYTEDFAERDFIGLYLREVGLEVDQKPLFFWLCATLRDAEKLTDFLKRRSR